jgi:uncharacterized membrane protein (DUF2068 family)
MQRPTGVTIIAILSFLGAAACIMLGLFSFVGGAVIAKMLANMPGMSALGGGIVAALGVVFLLIGALYAITGYGLWALKNWGRVIMIVLMALGLVFGLLGLVAVFSNFTAGAIVMQVIRLAICAWILWYLFQPNVKQAFGQTT